jgi:hypothetical protein
VPLKWPSRRSPWTSEWHHGQTWVLAQQELPIRSLAALLDAKEPKEPKCSRFLRRISAILDYEHGSLEPVRLLHASFSDYLCDRSRCDEVSDYSVILARDHLRLAELCLSTLTHHLRYNMCKIHDPSLFNKKVADLQQQLNIYVSEEIRYACRFWLMHWFEHMRLAGSNSCVPPGLDVFCAKHLLHWIELLSCIDAIEAVQHTMPKVLLIVNVSFKCYTFCANKSDYMCRLAPSTSQRSRALAPVVRCLFLAQRLHDSNQLERNTCLLFGFGNYARMLAQESSSSA